MIINRFHAADFGLEDKARRLGEAGPQRASAAATAAPWQLAMPDASSPYPALSLPPNSASLCRESLFIATRRSEGGNPSVGAEC
jgi:hypothetical protein